MDDDTIAASAAFLKATVQGNFSWNTEEVKKTPERFAKMIVELTSPQEFEFTTFDISDRDDHEMIIVKDISFVALCAHHVVPFVGKAWIGYVPSNKIAGLSKFARAVRFWSAGLWTQEDLTNSISAYLEEMLEPTGLGVVLEAEHMCMTIRGVQAPGTTTVTSSMRGVFLDSTRGARQEFLQLMGR